MLSFVVYNQYGVPIASYSDYESAGRKLQECGTGSIRYCKETVENFTGRHLYLQTNGLTAAAKWNDLSQTLRESWDRKADKMVSVSIESPVRISFRDYTTETLVITGATKGFIDHMKGMDGRFNTHLVNPYSETTECGWVFSTEKRVDLWKWFEAVKAEEIIPSPIARSGYKWSPTEEDQLCEMLAAGATVPEMAESLERTVSGINMRLKKLADSGELQLKTMNQMLQEDTPDYNGVQA